MLQCLERKKEQKELVVLLLGCKVLEKPKAKGTLGQRAWTQLTARGGAPHLHTAPFKPPMKNCFIRFLPQNGASLKSRSEILQCTVRWPWGKRRGIWQVLCYSTYWQRQALPRRAALLGNHVPVCSYVNFLIRKALAPGGAACLSQLLIGHRWFLSSSLFALSSWGTGCSGAGRAGLAGNRHLHRPAWGTCHRGHATCHQIAKATAIQRDTRKGWSTRRSGRKRCHSHSQTAQVSRND